MTGRIRRIPRPLVLVVLVFAWFFWYAEHTSEDHARVALRLSPWFTTQAACEQSRTQAKLIADRVALVHESEPCVNDGRSVTSGTGTPR